MDIEGERRLRRVVIHFDMKSNCQIDVNKRTWCETVYFHFCPHYND